MLEALIAETSVASTPALAQAAISNLATPHKGRKLDLLLLENNAADRTLILQELRNGGFDVRCEVVETALQFRSHLQQSCPDIVLANYTLAGWKGMEALAILREQCLETPLIIVSGAIGGVRAVECIKQGANDYVRKESLGRLSISVIRALRERDLKSERKLEKQHLADKVEELARSQSRSGNSLRMLLRTTCRSPCAWFLPTLSS